MKLSILAASSLFFTLAQSVPVTTEPAIGPADRHIIRHSHKVNCLNCFCGHKAIERARHACPADRDLVLCPPSIPVRACYRCACYPRVPVSPSPPIMKPHPEDDLDETDEMMMHTPDADEDMDAMPSKKKPTMKPQPTAMVNKPHPTMMPMATRKPHPTMTSESTKKPHPTMTKKATMKPHPTMKSMPTKKPHPTVTKKATMKPHPTMMSTPTKKPHPTMATKTTKKPHPAMMSKPTKKPHPTKEPQIPTPTPSSRACASFQRGGGGGNTMFDVDLMEHHGTFKISWQMDTVPDMIEIFYEDRKIFSTKVPVSGHGSAYVDYSGMSSKIRVWVTSPTSGTGWFLSIGCPKDDH